MDIVTVPCSFDNYSYIIHCPESGEVAVIDPTETYPVLKEIERLSGKLTTVLCTHHHHDHVGEIGDLISNISEPTVVSHAIDVLRITHANTSVEDGSTISFGTVTGEVLHTPGHTRGSVCYLFGEHLFTGDTLFGGGCGRLFEGTAAEMFHSLSMLLERLSDETRIYFGHEYTKKNLEFGLQVEPENQEIHNRIVDLDAIPISSPSTLGLEKKTNPFLRCHSDEIRKNVMERGYSNVQSPEDVFSVLREMRNSF